MNDLQKKQYEILKAFIEVCSTLSLRYFLVCGSALGAAKYEGFIPWDDDVDVALPREDYEIFCEKAQALLPNNLFVQNYKTDSLFPKIFTKIRDVSTTYIESEYKMLDISHGVFIDVFPLDGHPTSERLVKRFERKQKMYLRELSCSLVYKRSFKSKLLYIINRILGYHRKTNQTLNKYENMIKEYSSKNGNLWCNYGNFRGKIKKFSKEIYGAGHRATFEGIDVYIPEKYDMYLTEYYGDWRADLPKEQQYGHHFYEICDLNRPYTDYIERKPNGKIEVKRFR